MSLLREKLAKSSEPVFTAEFPSINGGGMASVKKHIEKLAPWFDALNATDNPAAHAHASNLAVAIAIKNLNVEPIMQIVCRDKNRLAIQADMVGAALHEITNISLLTGDDVSAGDEPEARRVFDLDGPQAITVAKALTDGRYLSGRKINPAPDFFIGAVENPAAPPLEQRIERAIKKHKGGAQFLQLQICFHLDRLEKFVTETVRRAPSLSLIPTLVLLKGAKQLNFLNDMVPGIDVPKQYIDQVAKASDEREAMYQLTLDIAKNALAINGVRGLHITDFRHDDSISRLMNDLGRTPITSMSS